MNENQEKARQVMNALYALEASGFPKSEKDNLVNEIAELRDAFFEAVPEAINDDRFAQMMGSPLSVLYFVTKYLRGIGNEAQE